MDRPVDEYTPFISKDVIHALGSSGLISITILWDTGANQSLLLENRLSQLVVTCASAVTLIQVVELKTVGVPLHIVMLNCDFISGIIMVGVWHSLPIKKLTSSLGNGLMEEKATAIPYMLNSLVEVQSNTIEVIAYPTYAITRAMAKWTQGKNQPLKKITTTEKDGGKQLELTDIFVAYDRELSPEQHGPHQNSSGQGENKQTQGVKDSGVSTIGKVGLIQLQ